MVPLWALFVAVGVSLVCGGIVVAFLSTPRKSVEVDRMEEDAPLNVFDAYSDKELKEQRDITAETIRNNRQYGYNIDRKLAYLREIDFEFKRRENAKLALEESKRTQHERDIAIFDTVYGHVLSDTEKKRIK